MTNLIRSQMITDMLRNDLGGQWDIQYRDLSLDNPYEVDTDLQIITIHNFGLTINKAMESSYFAPQIELYTIEAMRMARHAQYWDKLVCGLRPDLIITLARAIEADVQTTRIMGAWMARIQNNPILWRHILCGETDDMATAFVNGLENHLASGMDHNHAMKRAMAMAFNQWFACAARQQKCDHDTLNYIDGQLDVLNSDEKSLTTDMMKTITTLYGDCDSYLDNTHQRDIIKNPYYSTIRDEINQIHFQHVLRDMGKIYIGDLAFHDNALANRFTTIH